MPLDEVLREPPADTGERVLLALDCANERRLGPEPSILEQLRLVVDVDHHHDNTRFGAINLSSPTPPRPRRSSATCSASWASS